MAKQRYRFKQTTTLAHRLTQEADRLRDRARNLPAGPEQARLLRKVDQAETAIRIEEWLSSPGTPLPDSVVTLVGFQKGNLR